MALPISLRKMSRMSLDYFSLNKKWFVLQMRLWWCGCGWDGGRLQMIQQISSMIVSVSTLSFRQNENINHLQLQNAVHNALIFKLKITHADLFTVNPGKGIASPSQKVQVSVKLNRPVDVTAKLMVSYAQLQQGEEGSGASHEQLWSRIDKDRHQSIIIPISRTASKQPPPRKEEKASFKKTESPVYEMEIKGDSQNEPPLNNSRKIDQPIKKSLTLKNSTSMFRSVEDLEKRDTGESRTNSNHNYERLQRQLQRERREKQRMEERLIEREKKIMYLSNLRQMEVNRSLDKSEGESVWTCCNVALGAFLCLLIGFLLAKYEIPSLSGPL